MNKAMVQQHTGHLKKPPVAAHSRLSGELLAEAIGTFILVLFGCGAIATAVISGAQMGIWQVAVVWGFALALAIYVARATSGAHLNPAVTLAVAVFQKERFAAKKLIPYILAQFAGAFLAASVLYVMFAKAITSFEATEGIVRGEAGSQLSAMIFGEYFPNPAIFGTSAASWDILSPGTALLAEAIGTALLVFFIFSLTDPQNRGRPSAALTPFFIGFTISIIISVIGPLTQAGLNPARDFGPRLFAFLAGWDHIALPGPRWDFWIYVAGPVIGGLVGGFLYSRFATVLRRPEELNYRG